MILGRVISGDDEILASSDGWVSPTRPIIAEYLNAEFPVRTDPAGGGPAAVLNDAADFVGGRAIVETDSQDDEDLVF